MVKNYQGFPLAVLGPLVAIGFYAINLGAQELSSDVAQGSKHPVNPKHREYSYLGVGSCSSSNCHGASKPSSKLPILGNEFFTWYKEDKHSQAYKILLNQDAKRIASNLGLGSPEQEPACLTCHATFAKEELRGPKFNLEDGVSCESCHGAAGDWIRSHAEKDASHAGNVANGMHDLVPPLKRAAACISCHQGDESRQLNHRLYGAGHPRVGFESDTYEAVMPRHWLVDADYQKRKAPYSPSKAWLAGQYALAERFITELSKDSKHPDFSLYSCYSCHHDFARREFLYKSYQGKPGEPPLNFSHLRVLTVALRGVIKDPIDQEGPIVTADVTSSNGLTQLKASLVNLRKQVDGFNPNSNNLKHVLRALIKSLTVKENYDLQYIEQSIMGISALSSELKISSNDYQQSITQLYQATKNAHLADPEQISEIAARLLKKVE